MKNPFQYEIDIHGARVLPVREPLCSACLSDGEIDYQIAYLKADLDRVAKLMKKAIVRQAAKDLNLKTTPQAD